jgi:hypothetical protein
VLREALSVAESFQSRTHLFHGAESIANRGGRNDQFGAAGALPGDSVELDNYFSHTSQKINY